MRTPRLPATPRTETPRQRIEHTVWAATHRDFRGEYDGVRCLLACGANGGTTLRALADFSDAELTARISSVHS